MTFLAILCALLIEQFRPMRANNLIYAEVKSLAMRVEAWFNAGHPRHGRFGWLLMVLLLTVPAYAIHLFAAVVSPMLEFAWSVAIAYLTLGFRHYSHYFSSIQIALLSGDEAQARTLLAEWTKQDTTGMETPDIIRIAIEKALVTSHHNVFGVFFWFLLPFGPAGAVLYRVAEYLARAWNSESEHLESDVFGRFASKAFYWIDWIPTRLTAIAFAVVGDFEDAIYAWRNFANRWQSEAIGIILATGGGAIGIRLGTPEEKAINIPTVDAESIDFPGIETESQPGEEPSLRALQSTVGLVWRALLLWMLLLLLLSIAVWIG
jgi:adenosylcobinamide-phosphate synthase